jgi:hypothetical protein
MRTNVSRIDYRSSTSACGDHMRQGQADQATVVDEHLRADLEPVLRSLARWAAERPVLLDVTLFGDPLRRANDPSQPLPLAVRYDEQRMTEGFDDWIEQLRSGFRDLAVSLRQNVDVAPPNDARTWDLIARGTEIPALRHGKVRCVLTPAEPARAAAADSGTTAQIGYGDAAQALWQRVVHGLSMPIAGAIATRRRFVV